MKVRYRLIEDNGRDGPVVVVRWRTPLDERRVASEYFERAFPWKTTGDWWLAYDGLAE